MTNIKKEKDVKEEKVIELDGFHAKQLNYIALSLQHEEDTQKAIEFNKQHNYEYKFIAQNLINTRDIILLLKNGYKITTCFNDYIKSDVILIYHEKI